MNCHRHQRRTTYITAPTANVKPLQSCMNNQSSTSTISFINELPSTSATTPGLKTNFQPSSSHHPKRQHRHYKLTHTIKSNEFQNNYQPSPSHHLKSETATFHQRRHIIIAKCIPMTSKTAKCNQHSPLQANASCKNSIQFIQFIADEQLASSSNQPSSHHDSNDSKYITTQQQS